jgi:hypothetical protein
MSNIIQKDCKAYRGKVSTFYFSVETLIVNFVAEEEITVGEVCESNLNEEVFFYENIFKNTEVDNYIAYG